MWTIQIFCGSYPPLGRIKVKFLPCFSFFFLHLWFLGFYICDLFSFLHLWPKVFYIYDSVFFYICDISFTYDVEFLHVAFLFFTNVAVVTFVAVFTFKVLTYALSSTGKIFITDLFQNFIFFTEGSCEYVKKDHVLLNISTVTGKWLRQFVFNSNWSLVDFYTPRMSIKRTFRLLLYYRSHANKHERLCNW